METKILFGIIMIIIVAGVAAIAILGSYWVDYCRKNGHADYLSIIKEDGLSTDYKDWCNDNGYKLSDCDCQERAREFLKEV